MPLVSQQCRLCLVTDRRFSSRSLVDLVAEAVEGGVTLVQLREKDSETRAVFELGQDLKALLDPLGIPLIVNDRLDLALALDAAGVHLGQNDMPISIARALLGGRRIIGATVNTLQQAKEAVLEGADYLGVGAIYPTATKSDHSPVIGLDGLTRLRSEVALPMIGISGIKAENARGVRMAGADGVAVVSAILAAENPRSAAAELFKAVTLPEDESA